MQEAAANDAARHEADAKERLDKATDKAKEQSAAAKLARAGDKFDADMRAAREATLAGNGPLFLTPSAPDLAQAMHAAGPPRTTGTTRIGGTATSVIGSWFPYPMPGCFGGGATGGAAGQARRAHSQTHTR